MLMAGAARLDRQQEQIARLPLQHDIVGFGPALAFHDINDDSAWVTVAARLVLDEMFEHSPGSDRGVVDQRTQIVFEEPLPRRLVCQLVASYQDRARALAFVYGLVIPHHLLVARVLDRLFVLDALSFH